MESLRGVLLDVPLTLKPTRQIVESHKPSRRVPQCSDHPVVRSAFRDEWCDDVGRWANGHPGVS